MTPIILILISLTIFFYPKSYLITKNKDFKKSKTITATSSGVITAITSMCSVIPASLLSGHSVQQAKIHGLKMIKPELQILINSLREDNANRSIRNLLNKIDEVENLANIYGSQVVSNYQIIIENFLHYLKTEQYSRAQKISVKITLPLVCTYLPAFILVGIVPVIISLGTQFFH